MRCSRPIPSQAARAWWLSLAIALAGFAVFPACFFNTARDGLQERSHDNDPRFEDLSLKGMKWRLKPLAQASDPQAEAIAALRARGWLIDAVTVPETREPAVPSTMVTVRIASVTAHRWGNRAMICWMDSADHARTWSAYVDQVDDPTTGKPIRPWPDQIWEEMRLLHLLVPGQHPIPGWERWPTTEPVSLQAAAEHHWDPYTVWDPRAGAAAGEAGGAGKRR